MNKFLMQAATALGWLIVLFIAAAVLSLLALFIHWIWSFIR